MAPHPYEPPPPLPAENGVHVWRTAIVVPIITFFFVAARFYTRLYLLSRRPTIDDYIVGATMVVSIVHGVLIANATYHGMGLHIWQFTPELNSEYYLWLGISSQFYNLGLAGFKSALVLLYLQTFGLVSVRFRIACYLTLFYTLGYLTANLFIEFLGCWPIEKKWHSELAGHCINRTAANTFFGIGHVTSDLIIAILPLPSIWKLTFPTTRQKIGLSLSLSSGFLAWAVATVRYVISTYNQFTYDRPWWAGISFTFSILELNTGLICACVPTFSPLLSAWASSRVSNFITTWTGGSGVWQNSAEKTPWEDDYHAHLPTEPRETRGRRAPGRGGNGDGAAITPIAPIASRDMATFSPVGYDDDMPLCDLSGLQALAERDKV
ncbi:putative integral membrane protein [Rosellinia necatrix]|uniref:Putative integral membrane protein n=1 Tax=Rosellinia necatrix TaxID=77044 RepID=A0A1S7UJ44_ROSNE|nr:putative integral membrane protein [Rosellinia necatrix]